MSGSQRSSLHYIYIIKKRHEKSIFFRPNRLPDEMNFPLECLGVGNIFSRVPTHQRILSALIYP